MAEIHVFADHHIGDVNCNRKLIQQEIEQVQKTDNAYAVLNGDILNWASKTSVSDSYAEQYSPMEEMQMAVDLFSPIKDKIIGITPGNHERRAYRAEGIDVTYLVAKELGLAERYSKESLLMFVRLGHDTGRKMHHRPICYMLYANHGSGGGRMEGAKAIRLADMASIVDADVYLHAHTHLPMVMRQAFYRTSAGNSSVQKVDRLFVNTAAALGYGGYGELGEFKPNSMKNPVLYLNGREKLAEAIL